MKQIKKGFSLAEVLIAMGIISVIATIGFTIGRKSVETAYNQYIYTGYKGMSMAIANVISEGKTDFIDSLNPNLRTSDAIDSIARVLNDDNPTLGANEAVIEAPNRITYRIRQTALNGNVAYAIQMEVPAKKTRGSDNAVICLDYLPHETYGGVLIPVQRAARGCETSIQNIGDRRDLLPFYLDDGIDGRTIPRGEWNEETRRITGKQYEYNTRSYASINQALCAFERGGNIRGTVVNINCNGVQGWGEFEPGPIKVINPRKIY